MVVASTLVAGVVALGATPAQAADPYNPYTGMYCNGTYQDLRIDLGLATWNRYVYSNWKSTGYRSYSYTRTFYVKFAVTGWIKQGVTSGSCSY